MAEEVDVQTVKNQYDAALNILSTLEESLQPLVDKMEGIGKINLTAQYADHLRKLVQSVIAADGQPRQRERDAYQELFGTQLPDEGIERFADASDHAELTDRIADFIDWVGGFETKLGELSSTDRSLQGLTAGLVQTFQEIGMSLFVDRHADAERTERLRETTQACYEVLRQKGLDEEPIFDERISPEES